MVSEFDNFSERVNVSMSKNETVTLLRFLNGLSPTDEIKICKEKNMTWHKDTEVLDDLSMVLTNFLTQFPEHKEEFA